MTGHYYTVNELQLTHIVHENAGYARTDLNSLAFTTCATFNYRTEAEANAHTLTTGTRFMVEANFTCPYQTGECEHPHECPDCNGA